MPWRPGSGPVPHAAVLDKMAGMVLNMVLYRIVVVSRVKCVGKRRSQGYWPQPTDFGMVYR